MPKLPKRGKARSKKPTGSDLVKAIKGALAEPAPATSTPFTTSKATSDRLEAIRAMQPGHRDGAILDEMFVLYHAVSIPKWIEIQEVQVAKASDPDDKGNTDAFLALNEIRKTDLAMYKTVIERVALAHQQQANLSGVGSEQLDRNELARLVADELNSIEHSDGTQGSPEHRAEVEPVAGSVGGAVESAGAGPGDAAGPALGQAVGDDARGGPVAAGGASGPGQQLAALRKPAVWKINGR